VSQCSLLVLTSPPALSSGHGQQFHPSGCSKLLPRPLTVRVPLACAGTRLRRTRLPARSNLRGDRPTDHAWRLSASTPLSRLRPGPNDCPAGRSGAPAAHAGVADRQRGHTRGCRHDACRSLYWRSRARLPTRHPSWPTRRGTCPILVLKARGGRWLLPTGRPAWPAYNSRQPDVSGGYRVDASPTALMCQSGGVGDH
jgi:hypothetical protein